MDYIQRSDIYDLITDHGPKNTKNESARRDLFIKAFSYAIPTKTAIEKIAKHLKGKTLEVGAGSGLWSSLLQQDGCNIIPIDDGSWKINPIYTEVFDISYWEAIEKHHPDNLFLCWPPYDEPLAYYVLQIHQWKTVVYIGERSGGCTACDRFHKELSTWNLLEEIDIPQWYGLYDCVFVYNRM